MEDNFFAWLNRQKDVSISMDAAARLPKGETLEEHRKHCKAKKGACPFEKKVDEMDDLSAKNTKVLSQDELADIYEKEGVSENLVESTKQLHRGILSGAVQPKRISAEIFKNADMGQVPTWMTYAYLVASNFSHDDKKATQVLEDFAKASGNYIDNMQETFARQYGDPIGNGMESDVFDGGAYVIKSSTLGMDTKDTLSKIERIFLGNIYFPETGYQPFGLGTAPDGGPLFALRQNFVHLDKDKKLGDKEIEIWLKDRGWDLADPKERSFVSRGWDLLGLDMHNDNIVRTKDGHVVCIDPCVVPNTESRGLFGYYDYNKPPQNIS